MPGRGKVVSMLWLLSGSGCGAAAIAAAWVVICCFLAGDAARVLPSLAGLVPVKPKLGQSACDFNRLAVVKVNPHPFSYHFGESKESGCFVADQRQQVFCVESAVFKAALEIDRLPFVRTRLFGSVSEPCVHLKIGIHGLFFVLC